MDVVKEEQKENPWNIRQKGGQFTNAVEVISPGNFPRSILNYLYDFVTSRKNGDKSLHS